MRFAFLALALSMCTQNTAEPLPTPTSVQPPPVVSAPVQNPSDCDAECAQAQSACANPLPVAHCIGVCAAAAKSLSAPGIACLAKVATCNVECKP